MPLTGQLEGIITENSGRVTILKWEMCLWGKGGKFGKRGEEKEAYNGISLSGTSDGGSADSA